MREKRLGVVLGVVLALVAILALPAMAQENPVDFTFETSCGALDITLTNTTEFPYAVAVEEGSATYDWENNAVFGSQTYAEDYNGGSVDLWLYIVGAESDLVTGRDIPNLWEMNAVMVTVETDCLAAETTTTLGDTTTSVGGDTTTTVAVSDATLPFTGMEDSVNLWVAAALAIMAGIGLVLSTWNKRSD
ncbi:MAG TPA: hypothetical protein VIW94_06390 [Acidimicrobiia bacterium]